MSTTSSWLFGIILLIVNIGGAALEMWSSNMPKLFGIKSIWLKIGLCLLIALITVVLGMI